MEQEKICPFEKKDDKMTYLNFIYISTEKKKKVSPLGKQWRKTGRAI